MGNSSWQFLRRAVGGPSSLLLFSWGVYLTVLFLSPLSYNQSMSMYTWTVLCAYVILFIVGARFATMAMERAAHRESRSLGEQQSTAAYRVTINRRIQQVAWVGIFGTLLVVIDKVFIGGLDLTKDLGELRVHLNVELDRTRSILLMPGMMMYSFSNVALLMYILLGEMCTRRTGATVFLASFSPAVVVILYAGRSSAILLLIMLVCACLVRVARQQSFLPRVHFFQTMIAAHGTLVIFGSLYIFSVRSVAMGYDDSGRMLVSYVYDLDATISTDLQRTLARDTPLTNVLADSLMGIAYFTQGLPEFDYLINKNSDAGPFYGAYQAWVLYKLVVIFTGINDQTSEMDGVIHHTGFMFTAWGGVVLDFGPTFGGVFTFALGLLTGWFWVLARQNSVAGAMLLSYAYVFITVSPMHSAFCVGNALQVLFCIIAVSVILPARRRLVPAPQH